MGEMEVGCCDTTLTCGERWLCYSLSTVIAARERERETDRLLIVEESRGRFLRRIKSFLTLQVNKLVSTLNVSRTDF